VFDRVIVCHDEAGRVSTVSIVDFKTDRIRSAADLVSGIERYSSQLNLYRRVAGILTGLEVEKINCSLVFTATREICPIKLETR